MIRKQEQDDVAMGWILRIAIIVVLALLVQLRPETAGAADLEQGGPAGVAPQNYLTNICAALTRH